MVRRCSSADEEGHHFSSSHQAKRKRSKFFFHLCLLLFKLSADHVIPTCVGEGCLLHYFTGSTIFNSNFFQKFPHIHRNYAQPEILALNNSVKITKKLNHRNSQFKEWCLHLPFPQVKTQRHCGVCSFSSILTLAPSVNLIFSKTCPTSFQ